MPAACRSAAASEIEPSSTAEALPRCGPALVGGGSYDADVAFPEQSSFPSHGRIVAFNAVVDGQRAILAHVYGAEPMPITRIIVFHIRETAGTFGTILTGALPASLNRYGYLKRISLSLHRISPIRASGAATSAPPATLRPASPAPPSPSPRPRWLRRRSHPVLDPDPQLQGPG